MTPAHLGHLARRAVGSLRPGGPDRATARWVAGVLAPGEWSLWAALSGPDRRHSAGVARRVEAALGQQAGRDVLAAALLHDVGKAASGLRTPGRVVATVVGDGLGRARLATWRDRRGYRGRIERYLRHDELGAEALAAAGSPELVVAWAAEHHLPPTRWSIDPVLGDALKAADDD